MGRIKTKLIKRLTHELIERYSDRFTERYEENKKVVGELVMTESKKIKNAIAGYVTRLKRMQVE